MLENCTMGTPLTSEQLQVLQPPTALIEKLTKIFWNARVSFDDGWETKRALLSLKELKANHLSLEEIAYLQNHQISFVSVGNSLNVQVTTSDQQKTGVFGLVRPMGSPERLPDEFRNRKGVKQLFADKASVIPEQTMKRYKNEPITYYMANHYQNGSYLSVANKLTAPKRHTTCAGHLSKIARALKKLQDNEIFFPDAKIANWLIDSQGNPVILDDKSPRSFEQAEIRAAQKKGFLGTDGYWPPNRLPKNSEDFKKCHAYILGANIYNFLTDRPPPEIPKKLYDNFFSLVEQLPVDPEYKTLIKGLMNPDRNKRMTVETAIAKLEQLNARINPTAETGLQTTQDVVSPSSTSPPQSSSNLYQEETRAISTVKEHYKRANQAQQNKYLFNVNTGSASSENYITDKDKFEMFKGELLKAKLLVELQKKIAKVESHDALDTLEKTIKGERRGQKSAEYKILEKNQRLLSFGGKTKSLEALEAMIEAKRASLPPKEDSSQTNTRQGG
jgi:serine/threonine protein kinase